MAICINVGCGTNACDGWLNFDKSLNSTFGKVPGLRWMMLRAGLMVRATYEANYPSNVRRADVVRRGIPCDSGSADWVYCSHLLTQMGRVESQRLLRECSRVLRSGGRIRVVTLDLRVQAMRYKEALEAYLAGNAGYFEAGDHERRTLADRLFVALDLPFYTRSSLGPFQRFLDAPPRQLFDEEALGEQLGNAGFIHVERSAYRESQMPQVDLLDIHPKALHMEAEKA